MNVTERRMEPFDVLPAASRRDRNSYDMASARPVAPNSAPTQLTVVLMGAPRVGKTTLVNQFLWEAFIRDYRPTVEEFNWVEYETEEEGELLVQIIDSSGSRDFLAMRDLYYKTGDAFMVLYALDDVLSFSEAIEIMREIRQRNPKNAPILLVANKEDLSTETNSTVAGDPAEFARRLRIPVATLSAKNLKEVQKAFWTLMNEIRRSSSPSVAAQLRKRRQSMPSRRTASDLGIDSVALEQLVRRHDRTRRAANCTIS